MAFQVSHIIILCALFICYNLPIKGKTFQSNEQKMTIMDIVGMTKLEDPDLQNSNELLPVKSETKCECAVFSKIEVSQNDIPIMIHSPITTSYNEEEKANCRKLCFALAQAAKYEWSDNICSIIGPHHNKFQVSIHSRICIKEPWTYTGFTFTDLCCHEYKIVPCEELQDPPRDNKENII